LISVQNFVVVSHAVCMHVGSPKQFGTRLGRWRGWPSRNTLLPHMCHLTKFCRPRSIRLGVDMGPEKYYWCWDPVSLGWGVADP